jgi:hypothetical protein
VVVEVVLIVVEVVVTVVDVVEVVAIVVVVDVLVLVELVDVDVLVVDVVVLVVVEVVVLEVVVVDDVVLVVVEVVVVEDVVLVVVEVVVVEDVVLVVVVVEVVVLVVEDVVLVVVDVVVVEDVVDVVVVVAGQPSSCVWLHAGTRLAKFPVSRTGFPVSVPSSPPVESRALPEVSLNPQRPTRPRAVGTCWFIVSWMSACVRATFHTRTSSISPVKNPCVAPVEVSAEATAKCWMLSERGGWPTARSASRLPFR